MFELYVFIEDTFLPAYFIFLPLFPIFLPIVAEYELVKIRRIHYRPNFSERSYPSDDTEEISS